MRQTANLRKPGPAPAMRGWAGVWFSRFQAQAGWWIFLIAFLLRVAWVLTLDNALTWLDERDFAKIGLGLATGQGYVSDSFRANPGLPFYLSLVFRAFGENYLAARLGQCIFGALTCVLLCGVGTVTVGRTVGVISGLILAIYPPYIYLTGVFYVECLVTFLLTLTVYLVVCTARPGGKWWLGLMTGIALGMTILTRSTFVLYLPCVMLAWIYGMQAGWMGKILACVALCAGMAVVVLPWTWRNYRVFGRPVLVNSGFYSGLWRGNSELTGGSSLERDMMWYDSEWKERLQRLPADQQRALNEKYERIDRELRKRIAELGDRILAIDEVLEPVAIELVITHPLRTARLFVNKVMTLYSAFSPTYSSNAYTTGRVKMLAGASFYPILVLGLAGIWLGWAWRRELTPLYLLIGVVTLAHGLLIAATRYRLPIDAFWIVLASVTLVRVFPTKTEGDSTD